MKQKKIRVLHFVQDDKFIDGPIDNFERDDRFENEVVMIVDSPDYTFSYVKNTERIKLLYTFLIIKLLFGGRGGMTYMVQNVLLTFHYINLLRKAIF